MYEAKQRKEKVSRTIGGGGRDWIWLRSEYLKNNSSVNEIIQTYRVKKGWNNSKSTTPYMVIGKTMKSASDKIAFYDFLISTNETDKDFQSLDRDYIVSKKRPNKREGYYISITENCKNDDYWINWNTQATGDLTSMSAAILMGFQHGIRIVKGNDLVSPVDRTNLVSSFLGGVIDPTDNHFIINDDGWKGTYTEKNIEKKGLKFSWLTNVVATGKYVDKKTGVKDSIKRPETQNGYNEEAKRIIRHAWLGDKDYTQKIIKWLYLTFGLRASDLRNKLITILWIRKSGERGGAHYENDTSFSAIESYLTNHTAGYYFLAGDDKLDANGASKAKRIAGSKPKVYNLTEFWKDTGVRAWNGNSRTGQFGLYDYLYTLSGGNLIHVGSMSGGLEAFALLGHKVNFKAKDGETGVNRMKRYEGTPIPYDRINFEGNHAYYDYAGFEKSSAKYYVFFSSGVINQSFGKNANIKNELYKIFNTRYIKGNDYKIYKDGLNGRIAQIAIEVSKELAHKEKEELKKKIEEDKAYRKIKEKKYRDNISHGNPNRTAVKSRR